MNKTEYLAEIERLDATIKEIGEILLNVLNKVPVVPSKDDTIVVLLAVSKSRQQLNDVAEQIKVLKSKVAD